MRSVVFSAACLIFVLCANALAEPADGKLSAEEVFGRRILPIARSAKASSCTECHFGGVELKNYIREDEAATFAALRDEGLIDIEKPDESKLLTFIRRSGDKTDPLLAKVREAEYAAFHTWIHAAVKDPRLLAVKSTDVKLRSELSPEVIRHMRRDRVVASFVENIWSEIGRCLHCHSPESNQKQVEKHGEQMSWIRPRDPAGTLAQCVEQGIIDPDAARREPDRDEAAGAGRARRRSQVRHREPHGQELPCFPERLWGSGESKVSAQDQLPRPRRTWR